MLVYIKAATDQLDQAQECEAGVLEAYENWRTGEGKERQAPKLSKSTKEVLLAESMFMQDEESKDNPQDKI